MLREVKGNIKPNTMPLYTKARVAANPEKFLELAQPPPACEICFESFTAKSPARSPLLGDRATTCRHFACENCWKQIMETQPREQWKCPQCRQDVQQWLDDNYEVCISTQFDDISMVDVFEFLKAALCELHDRPQFVEMGRRILQHLHASQ